MSLLRWLRPDGPRCDFGDILPRLDKLRRLSRPPQIKMPALERDSAGRALGPRSTIAPRPAGNWDSNTKGTL